MDVWTECYRRDISIHALREESDFSTRPALICMDLFQSTPSARRATLPRRARCPAQRYFNPRPPRGERPIPSWMRLLMLPYFNPRPPRGERLAVPNLYRLCPKISIHALREESDGNGDLCRLLYQYFNPRPPRGERRCFAKSGYLGSDYFNPRPPRGERRSMLSNRPVSSSFQSTPSARRATRRHAHGLHRPGISIHALREESDKISSGIRVFLQPISIHALREESDAAGCLCVSVSHNFNPRPPRGERQMKLRTSPKLTVFQSTPSARRATLQQRPGQAQHGISIHALREESD